MKTLKTILILSLFLCAQIFAQPTPPDGYHWEVHESMTDEFDTFDNTKWNKVLWNYGVPVQMKADNCGVSDGKFWIKASVAEDSLAERWFETSRIYSKSQISYPMYTECYMKASSISAYCTFWFNNGDANGRDEIDVCESNGNPSLSYKSYYAYTLKSQYFIVEDSITVRDDGDFNNNNLSSTNPLRGVEWDEAYHTIGMWWKDARNVQFYLNGEEAGNIYSQADFTRNLNMIFDMWTAPSDTDPWVGGEASQQLVANDNYNTMYVDWVHTYTLEEGATPIDKNKVSNIKVYPNPASSTISISSRDNINQVKLFTLQGELIQQWNNPSTILNISELKNGIYIIHVESNTELHKSKLVKE